MDGLSRVYDAREDLLTSGASFLISAGSIQIDPKARSVTIPVGAIPLKGMHEYKDRMESDRILKSYASSDAGHSTDLARDAQVLNEVFLSGALTADTQ